MRYFLSPKVLFGAGALKRLGAELAGKGSRAMIITDPNMAAAVGPVVDSLTQAGYEVKVWDGVQRDPTLDTVVTGGQALAEFGPQWVIGFGGGSAIDTAKAAWVFYERPDLVSDDPYKNLGPKAKLNLRAKARLVCVPTTSGTGADVTWVAVVTDTVKGNKRVLANNEIVPDVSVLDPELTVGLPPELTGSTGMDVLAHAIDGYTSRQVTDFSDGLCLQAMMMVFEWLPRAFQQGDDLVAREKMQNAATIGGLGFGNSNTGLSHALGHSAGALFHLSHARAVSLALPLSLEYIASKKPHQGAPDPQTRLATLARAAGIDAGSPQEAIGALVAKIRDLQKVVGEPSSLKEAGITEDQMTQGMDRLVSLARSDLNMLTTPCPCDEDDLRGLFRAMWSGAG